MSRIPATFVLAMLLSVLTVAQSSGPTPQQAAMGYFAGDWTLDGTVKVSPGTPGGPLKGTEHGEWVQGNFFLETHSKLHSPLGDVRATRVMEYNPQKNAYVYNVYNSLGEHQLAIGEVQGSTWIWNAEEQMNGVTTRGRYTMTILSPNAYTFKSEVATPTGGWSTVMEGKATRTQ